MSHTRIQYLIAKQLRGTITAAEQEELDAWMNASPDNRAFVETQMQPHQVLEEMKAWSEIDDDELFQDFRRLASRPGLQPAGRGRRVRMALRWGAAAAVVILLVLPLWYLLNKNRQKRQKEGTPFSSQLAVYRRADSVAVIMSGDGKAVSLESAPVGQTMRGDSYISSRTGKRSLSLQLAPEAGIKRTRPWAALISVPYGQSWQLTLWEGSQVEIGPGTVLAVLRGTSQERALSIDGEALFKVGPDKQAPFRVNTADVAVDVLGTSFNIKSFSDEHTVTTTLLSGKVKVSRGIHCNILLPGEEAIVDASTESMRILTGVDTTDRMAWLSPYFNFNNKTIPQVMRQVARWYGIKNIIYQRGVDTVSKGLLGGGHVGKEIALGQLLKRLESESHFTFKVKDNKIMLVGPAKYTSMAYAPSM